ncbi:MAG: EamA family transporter, partial [Calditrichia bacterium]|nr:EamA family transporter [Calditrichia bacterium]
MYTFLLLLVTIIWGSTFFIIKDTVASVSEFFIVFGRTFIAAASMTIFLLFKNRKSLLNIFSLKKGTILGFLMAIIYSSQTIGLKYTSSGHSAFVTGSAFIVVPILLYVFYKQKIKIITIISILIVFSGL